MDFVIALAVVLLAAAWLGVRWVRGWRRQVQAARERAATCGGTCGGCAAEGQGCDGPSTLEAIREHFDSPARRKR